jgi:hypothetical protein
MHSFGEQVIQCLLAVLGDHQRVANVPFLERASGEFDVAEIVLHQ